MDRPAANPLDLLPHGEPFRFLTRVITLTERESGVAEWDLSGEEDFFRGHFPGAPIVPGVLLTEAAAQLCGLVACSPEGDSASGPGGVRLDRVRLAQSNMKFPAAATPPTTIVLHAEYVRAIGPLSLLSVRAESGSVVVAEGSITLAGMPGEAGDNGGRS